MIFNTTNSICQHALQHVFLKGKSIIKDKKTIKQKLFQHTNQANHQINSNLIEQTGIKQKKIHQKYKQDSKPTGIRRDTLSYRSVNKSRNKSQRDKEKQGVLRRKNSPSISNRSMKKQNNIMNEENGFIYVDDEKQDNGRIVIKRIKQEEENELERLRKKKQKQNRIQEQQKKANFIKKQQQKEKRQKMDRYLGAYFSKKGNKITFDEKGRIVYFNSQRQNTSIKKKYPPSALQFSFDQVPDLQAKLKYNQHIKQRAARGDAFASSVLKTMNFSKISMMNATCLIDQHAFMKRNDLFNNNHSRQITNIPYIQVADGTSFTQTNTNLSLSKKNSERRTIHSETKSKFKTHIGKHNENSSIIDVKSQHMDINDKNQMKQVGKRRAQSSYAGIRPRPKSSVPLTSRGRITSVNQQLVIQLLQ